MQDDGLGLAILAHLRRHWVFDPQVSLEDGGTWGMALLPLIEDAGRLVLLDAIRSGAAPGTVVTLERDELPRLFALKLSPHQVDLREVLALAELRGRLPAQTVAIGIEPGAIALGEGLSPPVAARLQQCAQRVVARLQEMGHVVEPSTGPEEHGVGCTASRAGSGFGVSQRPPARCTN
jgi:hydrogenase maturation protease